jgi:hypothetical protein
MSGYNIINKGKRSMLIRNSNGRFQRIPNPLFFDGEVVISSEKHHTPNRVTIVTEPVWTDKRGWVYTETYCKVRNNKISIEGGCGRWFDEDNYLKLSNPLHLVIAEIHYREKEKSKLEYWVKKIDSELDKLTFTLNLFPKDNSHD